MKSGQIDRSMQTMQVSQKQASASAETLAFALRQVNDLGIDIKKAFEEDDKLLEKFAREEYLMKKKTEDIYYIPDQ